MATKQKAFILDTAYKASAEALKELNEDLAKGNWRVARVDPLGATAAFVVIEEAPGSKTHT